MAIELDPKIIGIGFGFDDVLLVPQRSDIRSRYGAQINTRTLLAKGVYINTPVVSANMDTVTEKELAFQMANLGGAGIIHRFMTVEDQAEQVREVKGKYKTRFDTEPLIVTGGTTVAEIQTLLESHKKGYVVVNSSGENDGSIIGIATRQNFQNAENKDQPIETLMIPAVSQDFKWLRQGASMSTAIDAMRINGLQRIPVFNDDNLLVGVYVLKDDDFYGTYQDAAVDAFGRPIVGAAIGVNPLEDEVNRAFALVEAGVDVLVLDIAHGELDYTKDMLYRLIKIEGITTPIIAGNFASETGPVYAAENGAAGVKIGVGPGLVCDTRDIAGTGYPQWSAIRLARKVLEAKGYTEVAVMGDGGIRKPGDVPKAIGAGADTVMIGSYLAGTEESPGEAFQDDDGVWKKKVRGMASASAFEKRAQLGGRTNGADYIPEGNEKVVPLKGPLSPEIKKLSGGLRSGMSYTGARTILEMQQKSKFVIVFSSAPEQHRKLV